MSSFFNITQFKIHVISLDLFICIKVTHETLPIFQADLFHAFSAAMPALLTIILTPPHVSVSTHMNNLKDVLFCFTGCICEQAFGVQQASGWVCSIVADRLKQ